LYLLQIIIYPHSKKNMLYYTLTITSPDGTTTKRDKLTHTDTMLAINNTISAYGFSKPITYDTFHNILCRPNLLPERLKWLMNTGKLSVERTNQPKPAADILQLVQSLPVN
jgi:hypothetical protein